MAISRQERSFSSAFFGFVTLPQDHPLEHPEHVTGGEDDAGGGDGAVDHVGLKGAQQDEKFTHEAVSAGHGRWTTG